MTLFTEYAKIRELHPDAIPLLRVGDFYETYGEGADTLARVLGLALTTRRLSHGGLSLLLLGAIPCPAGCGRSARCRGGPRSR